MHPAHLSLLGTAASLLATLESIAYTGPGGGPLFTLVALLLAGDAFFLALTDGPSPARLVQPLAIVLAWIAIATCLFVLVMVIPFAHL